MMMIDDNASSELNCQMAMKAETPFSSTSSESSENDKRCEAMYDYAECDPNNITMRAGEHFVIVEEEVDGWTRVRRLIGAGYDEGYVPASYLRVL